MPTSTDTVEHLTTTLLALGRERRTGTLRVKGTEEQFKQILFQDGAIADIDVGREETLLEAAVLDSSVFSEREIRQATKRAQKMESPLSGALLELGKLSDDVVEESIRVRLTDEIAETFAWPRASTEFFDHDADERLDTFYSDLSSYYEVFADTEETIVEVAQRLDRWDLVQKHFKVLHDVFYATPEGFRYFREQGQYPQEHALLSRVDGVKDASEVIAESGLNPFTALLMFQRMQINGELELINPVQMYQLGVDHMARCEFEKACKLFERAHERGLDDFDLQLKLAQSYESLGRKSEAIRKYLDFSEKCLDQFRTEDALKSLERVTHLAPDLIQAHQQQLKILLDLHRGEEAIRCAVSLAHRLRERGDIRAGLDVLLRAKGANPRDIQLQQEIISFAEACGDHERARSERELLARNCDDQKDLEAALNAYQRMFCEGDHSIETRLKLVELHKAKGNSGKALDHITGLLSLPEKKRPLEASRLLQLHEWAVELRPTDLRSNRWLVDHYTQKGNPEKASGLLVSWISQLEKENDLHEAVNAYRKLIDLDRRFEYRLGLVRVLEKLGRAPEALATLKTAAADALRAQELEHATKATVEILERSPLDVEAKRIQADVHEAQNQPELAAKRHEEVALLCVLSGNVQEAEAYCRRLEGKRALYPEIVRRLGVLCLDRGDKEKAVEQLAKAARYHLKQQNFGLCRNVLDELLRVDSKHAEGLSVQSDLRAALEGASRSSAVAQPVPAPQTAVDSHGAGSPQPSGGLFEAPPTIRTTVSSITARLKKLKGGGAGPVRTVSTEGAVEPEPQAAAPGSSASDASSGGTVVKSKALSSAAARLKALALKKAQSTRPAAAVAEEDGPGSTSEPPPAAEGAPSAPQPAASAPPTGGSGSEGDSQAPPVAVRKLKLGSSASRLAALRSQGAAQA